MPRFAIILPRAAAWLSLEDRLPVNDNGYGLGIAPALGYQIGRANAQIVFLGTSAVTLTFGYNFWN